MTLWHRFISVARWILKRDRAEQELDEELRVFAEMSAADRMRDGVPPAEARRLAAIELGGLEQVKEHVRARRHGGLLDEMGRDLRYAIRMFVGQRGFTFTVVVTLALGIGANTAVFSLIDALMLRSLPVRQPQELLQVKMRGADASEPFEHLSYGIVRAVAEQSQAFAGVAGFSGRLFNVGPAGSMSRVSGATVTGGFYDTLGLNPVAGRLLRHDDDRPGAPAVAVLSYGYWERQFQRDSGVVGRSIPINSVPVAIVGVSPRGFVGANVGMVADITLPVAALPLVDPSAAPLLGPGNFWLRALARPQPGVSASQAGVRMTAAWKQVAESVIAPHWAAARRKEMADSSFVFTSGGTGWTYLRELYAKPLLVLMGVVTLVLLIACANVASLLLARASARHREIAIRLAIGASRGRIVRQLLLENTLLAGTGAAGGIGLAWLCGRAMVALISDPRSPIVFDLTPNGHVLAFTGGLAVLTAMLFGLAPALQTTMTRPSRSRLLPALVSAQVALSLVLLVGAGLFVRTLQNLQRVDPGFTQEGVLVVDLESRRTAVPREVADRLARLPGVMSASLSTHTPLSGSYWSEPAVPAGQPLPERDTAMFVAAGPRFFETMGIGIVTGRPLTESDAAGAPGVAVVNERYAQRYFPNQSVVGRRLTAKVRGDVRDLEIVGVVRNVKGSSLRGVPPATVYVAYEQLRGDVPTTVEVRAAGPLAPVAAAVRRALQEALPTTPIDVRPLSMQVDATKMQERMMAMLMGAFGGLALTLACIGLYGLLAYSVARRTKEIGIRMALGAQRPRVIAVILRQAAVLVCMGIALGLPAAWAASRWIKTLLFGLEPTDPFVVVSAIALLMAAAQVAAYLPARRASLVNPLTALRYE